MTMSCQWNGTVPCWLPLSVERVVKCNWYCCIFSLPFSFSRYLYRVLGGVKLTSCAHRQSTVQMEVCVHLRDSRGSGWVRRVSAQQVRCLWRRQIRSFSPGVFSSDAASESDLSRAPYFSKINVLQTFREFTSLGLMILHYWEKVWSDKLLLLERLE